MTHAYILWIALTAYAIHVLEEFEMNWRDWARNLLRLSVDWDSFYLANFAVVVIGVSVGAVGWRAPWFALSLPALMLINATFFHVLPTIVTRIYSPGLVTAIALFFPVGGWAYYGAWRDGVLTPTAVILSLVIGAGYMATPVVLLKIKQHRGMH